MALETPGRSVPPTRDDEEEDDELTSPFDMIRSVPRSSAGHSATPKAPHRPSEVVDVLPGKTRIVFACMLPLLMIAATFAVQKKVMLNAGSPLRHRERSVFERNNALLLNRSCAPQLQPAVLRAGPAPSDASDSNSVRLVVGGGFAASGLSAVASMIQSVPGACHPSRADPSFWSALADSTSSFAEDLRPRPGLPSLAETRRRYLHDAVRLREGPAAGAGACWLPWEVSESRYTSVQRGARALCVPFIVRHYFPAARTLLMLADPVQRAHQQQSVWLNNRCYRDAASAAAAREGRPVRLAKGAPEGCASFGAQRQLRLELTCVQGCGLSPRSALRELLQCASTCSRQLRAAFPCRAATAAAPGAGTAKGRRLSKRRSTARRKAERRLSTGAAEARPSRRLRDQRAGRAGVNASRLPHLSGALSSGRVRRSRDKEHEQDQAGGRESKESHGKDKAKEKAAPLNCPYLSLVGSFYSLLLPLWLHAFPCDQLLILQRDAFFGTSPPTASTATAFATAAAAPSTPWDRQVTQLPPPPHGRPATGSSRPPPLPPPRADLARQELLRATLRFLGLSSANASALAQLPRFQPTPPHVGLGSNPIDEPLRRELNAYFAPFQEHLRKLLASHIKCFHERTSSKRKRRKTKVVV